MLHNKLWISTEVTPDAAVVLSEKTGISPLIARIFLSRGIDDTEYIKRFMNPALEELHDPFLLMDMGKAVSRIVDALQHKEKIVIYGDYDVDGITSTSIIFDFLRSLKADVSYFIPDRIHEGYGLSYEGLNKVLLMNPNLVITVDCGISAFEQVEYIKEKNIDIIITDHHECKDSIPEAYAVINPHRPDCRYPFKELAGVGVAFKVVSALCKELGIGNRYLQYLDLAALGTIADVVPLLGENRVIVKYGLESIEKSDNLGIKTLTNNCNLQDKAISSWTVSFVLAPRINAAGRIGDAGRAVQLFTTVNETEATGIAIELNDENKFRQDTELEILEQVFEKMESQVDLQKEKVIVVVGDEWHHGIIGIVASRITEKYYRPCILLSNEDGQCKGSGRSIEGFNLFKALQSCEDLVDNYGGHELAAGLTIKLENIEAFKKSMNIYADSILRGEDLIPRIKIDIKLRKEDINYKNIRELEKLAPFGAANPSPLFAYENFKISEMRTVGEDKHLKLKLEDNGFFIDAIGFNMGNLINTYCDADILDVACSLEINTWNSVERLQLNLKDIKQNDEILMEKQYFYSLDRCVGDKGWDEGGQCLNDCPDITKTSLMVNENFIGLLSQKEKIAILVNSLEDAKNLKYTLKKYASAIKKSYKICYTCFDSIEQGFINVIINPNVNEIDFSCFDLSVIYGIWIDRDYFNSIISKIDNSKLVLVNFKFSSPLYVNGIVPERRDLVAVYQYIKANSTGRIVIEDAFAFAKKIALSYKINMNYFKFMKCIEIFEELNLIKRESVSNFGITVKILDSKEKTNLENSRLYRKLQALKAAN